MRPGTTLFFIRHGETDWNAERRYQGRVDIPLNATGRSQARRNGIELRALLANPDDLDFVSSPLSRARETMEIVRDELGLSPGAYSLDERLLELSYGTWEGQLQSDLPTIDMPGLMARNRDPFSWRPERGESYADLLDRVAPWVKTIERDTVVTSHGGVSRCLRAHLLGLDPETIPELESPQDRVLVIRLNEMRWV
jgi:broad specificity phosphatase PhoE